jgi:hypothetical protein
MDYQLLVASEMESFIRVLGTAGTGRMPDAAERARRRDDRRAPAADERTEAVIALR